MAKVKQEEDMGAEKGDNWLSYWANPQVETVKKETNSGNYVKKEFSDNSTAMTSNVEQENTSDQVKQVFSLDASIRKHVSEIASNVLSNSEKKKTKTNLQRAQNGSFSKDTRIWRETFEKAQESEQVEDLCEYKCPTCSKVFSNRNCLGRHKYKSRWRGLGCQGIIVTYKDCLTKIVIYKCLICHDKLLCEKHLISRHIERKHKISMKEYLHKWNLNCKFDKVKVPENILEDTKFLPGSIKISRNIGNKCKFSCGKCDFTSNHWKLMSSHKSKLNHGHSSNIMDYVTSLTIYKCQICCKHILCDTAAIWRHIVEKHKLSQSHYKKMYKPIEKRKQYLLELKSVIEHIPAVKHNSSKYFLQANALRVDETTGDIGNLSFFKCPKCPKTDMTYGYLLSHVKREHGMKHQKCMLNLVEARYHRCHICSKNILCDNTLLSSHMMHNHKINLAHYGKDYVCKNGFRVYPTFDYFRKNQNVFDLMRQEMGKIETISNQDSDDNGLISPSMLSSESEDSDCE